MMLDGVEFGKEVVDLVRGYIEREVAPLKAENESLKARIAALEERPAPEKGEPGEKGADGVSPDPEAVAAALLPIAEDLIGSAVKSAVDALPPPERGEKGDPGERGEKGDTGGDGKDGRDGADVTDFLIDRDGNLVVTLSTGATKNLGPICGKDGAPGKDGRDGFGFDDLDACVLDDDRTIELSFRRGEDEKAFTFKWPTVIYRNVFSEGQEYQPGDMVTWAGSLWHCDKATTAKPGTEDWTLACKKGRDGKDAKANG